MVKRAPSGARVERFLSSGWQRRFLRVLLPERAATAPPHPATPAGEMPLLGPPRGPGPRRPAARPWLHGGSAAPGPCGPAPVSRLPPPGRLGAHQLRRSRAPGAAPSDRTTRARGRGRPRRRHFEARAPAGSPRLRATVVAPSLREGASLLRPWPLAEDPGALNGSPGVASREDPFSVYVHAGLCLLPFLFLFSHLATAT